MKSFISEEASLTEEEGIDYYRKVCQFRGIAFAAARIGAYCTSASWIIEP